MQKNEIEGLLELNILKAAVNNANEAFVTIDRHSTVMFFNKAAERIFGYERNEVIGRDLAEILGPGCREGHERAVNNYIKTRKGRLLGHESEFQAMRKNGETFPASISFSLTEVDGSPYFTGIVRELTETKALHDQVVQAERLAALGQMAAEIGHEIKNPLVMIGGFARQLQKNIQSDKERAKLKMIVTEVERLERLLVNLKDLYRPSQLEFTTFDIDELVGEVCALAEMEADNSHITIDFKKSPGDKTVSADRDKLKQVLLNIIKNSCEALPGQGKVTVRSVLRDQTIRISIIDTGEGISPDIMKKVFSPFFTTKEDGTGLGLCISKRIIEDHTGGCLTMQSEEGKGTTVTIELSRHA